MGDAMIHCPHCKAALTLPVGEVGRCPSCSGEVRVQAVGEGVTDEALKRLLSSVKIVERVAEPPATPQPPAPSPKKRPWWRFWG
jgi:uncharacterized Zn finger protein (UPF0148 family)